MSSFLSVGVHRGTKIHDSKKGEKGRKRDKKTHVMAPTDPRYTIRTNINTKAVHVTSLAGLLRRYGANNINRILFGTSLKVKIGPKATALDRRRNFFVAIFDLGGGDMKVDTVTILSVNLHTPENFSTSTGGDGDNRAASSTTTATGETTVTDPVSVQFLEAPAPDPLNYETLRVVVAQPMAEAPGRPLSPLTEAGGLVVVGVLAHVMDAYTVETHPPPPLPRLLPLLNILPVPLPPPPLPLIPAPCTPSP